MRKNFIFLFIFLSLLGFVSDTYSAAISTWSTNAASNNATPPDGWPEGQAPSTVNNTARETHAAIRTFYENTEWRDWGHTVTRTGNTTFTIAADVTAIYTEGRRIRMTDSSTLYGTIASSSFSSPNTTVTVFMDSGTMSASLSAVALGTIPGNYPVPLGGIKLDDFKPNLPPDLVIKNGSTAASTIDIDSSTGIMVGDGTRFLYVGNGGINLTVDVTASGANGLDSGDSESASEWLYIFIIAKADGTVGGLLSETTTPGSLPTDYDYYRRVGAVFNDSTSNFLEFYQISNRVYYVENQANLKVLTDGTSTTFAAISLVTHVPPTSIEAYLEFSGHYDNSSVTEPQILYRPTGSGLSTGIPVLRLRNGGGDEDVSDNAVFVITNTSQSIDYRFSNAIGGNGDGLNVYVLGYIDQI